MFLNAVYDAGKFNLQKKRIIWDNFRTNPAYGLLHSDGSCAQTYSQQDSSGMVKYTPDFKFKEGYLSEF